MCNLSGYSGKQPNIDKLKILALYGQSRGRDSIGIVNNNQIHKGTDLNNKLAEDYFTLHGIEPFENEYNSIIIHNRARSIGPLTADAAQPFYYKTEDSPGMYFMHNGTVSNYLIIKNELKVEGHFVTDSHLLGHILYHYTNDVWEEVLKGYEGAANFVWFFDNEPNKIYFWKGASYDNNKLVEERPLYYTLLDDGMYFNSLAKPLLVINNVTNKPIEFKNNHITVFNNGVLESETPVERTYEIPKPKTNIIGYNNRHQIVHEISEWRPYMSVPNKVYYYLGNYYVNNVIMSGIFNINDDDRVVEDVTEPEYYFYKGRWIKNLKTYNSLINATKPTVWVHDLHHQAIGYCEDKNHNIEYYQAGKMVRSTKLKPRFSDYEFTFDNFGKLIKFQATSTISTKKTLPKVCLKDLDIDSKDYSMILTYFNQIYSKKFVSILDLIDHMNFRFSNSNYFIQAEIDKALAHLKTVTNDN